MIKCLHNAIYITVITNNVQASEPFWNLGVKVLERSWLIIREFVSSIQKLTRLPMCKADSYGLYLCRVGRQQLKLLSACKLQGTTQLPPLLSMSDAGISCTDTTLAR